MNTIKIICNAVIILILSMTTQSLAAEAPCASAAASGELPFSLTISGGISLGSYEAGVNWALIEYMKKIRDDEQFKCKKPKLKAITGASAGAINSVMTAMLWLADDKEMIEKRELDKNICHPEFGVSADENILRNAWVGIGIDELLPKDNHKYCNPGKHCYSDIGFSEDAPENSIVDEMFTRRAFKPSTEMIRNLLKAPIFKKEAQKIYIALIATREKPMVIPKGGIKVNNQRVVFMLQFVTDKNGNGHFESKGVENIDDSLGAVAYLPQSKLEDGNMGVDPDDLIRLLFASSAFPTAFSKVNLTYCTKEKDEEAPVNESKICESGMKKTSSEFIDGGVFDNVPLGPALSLLETCNSENNNFFFFISPSTRRGKDDLKESKNKAGTYGLGGMLAFIPGFMAAASDHELYNVLRNEKWQSYDYIKPKDSHKITQKSKEESLKLVVTDRFFPITGAFLDHFGAFLDRPFREFDYNAGVYDAVNNLSKFMKKIYPINPENTESSEAQAIFTKLGLDKPGKASLVFRLIAYQEHVKGKDIKEWPWIDNPNPSNETMFIIFKSINETISNQKNISKIDDSDGKIFNTFIEKLHAEHYIDIDKNEYKCSKNNPTNSEHSETMRWIMDKNDEGDKVWYSKLVGRASMRLQNLQIFENADNKRRDKNNAGELGLVAGGASLVAGRLFDSDGIVLVQPHSIPSEEASSKRALYNLIPYELAIDTANGGISISYLGRLNLPYKPAWPKISIDIKLTPLGYNKFGDGHVGFSQADLYLSFNRLKSLWAVGLGPTVNYLWKSADRYHRANLGAAVYGEFFQTLRLTIGLRDFAAQKMFGHNYYVTLGLVDIPGLLYRIFK